MKQPLCRCCGGKIRKSVTTVYVQTKKTGYEHASSRNRYAYVDPLPKSAEEAARLTNQQIISVKKNRDGVIYQFNEWDGKSYVDKFFCTGTCAQMFGRLAAEATTLTTTAYNKATRGEQ